MPSIPRGTRDFSPVEMNRRNYIFDTIRSVFKLYGYQPIETPAMENLSTLLGKYGEEGDKLLFKILNSGDFLSKADEEVLAGKDSAKALKYISEKGLRYDLTVPFARYVVQHAAEIVFPFKRYQIQPVWRADRPQKGRYREFYQCDVDVIGSGSLLYEAEMVRIAHQVFAQLGVRTAILLNNRKILAGIAETLGETTRLVDITVAIDKMDKVGIEGVTRELLEKGMDSKTISALYPILELEGNNHQKLDRLEEILRQSPTGCEGIAEVKELLDILQVFGLPDGVTLDLTLARGLNYYTGAILEIKALDVEMGSISGGGRYDDLTGIFGMPGMSGVGISFGADRIYDVMLQLGLFPTGLGESVRALIVNFGGAETKAACRMLKALQGHGIAAEMYPEAAKMKKQFAYADARKIPFAIIIGQDEASKGMVTLKDMVSGQQTPLPEAEVLARLA